MNSRINGILVFIRLWVVYYDESYSIIGFDLLMWFYLFFRNLALKDSLIIFGFNLFSWHNSIQFQLLAHLFSALASYAPAVPNAGLWLSIFYHFDPVVEAQNKDFKIDLLSIMVFLKEEVKKLVKTETVNGNK